MSCSSEMEAEPLGILQITYRLLGIDPYDDLANVIQRIGTHPVGAA